jgi:multidrug efflux pump subunit AcrA (membrane-fusion protein)
MTLRTLLGATVVPQSALIMSGNNDQRSLYVVDETTKTAQLRPVQMRYAFGEYAAIEGVKPGERVVTDGKQNLRPGSLVRVAAASGQPAARASAPAGAASMARSPA